MQNLRIWRTDFIRQLLAQICYEPNIALKKKKPIFKKLNTCFTYNTTIPFLGIHTRDMKIYVHTKTCMQIFIVALFIDAKNWT